MKKVGIICETYGTGSQLGAIRYGLRKAGWKVRCFVPQSNSFKHLEAWKPHGIIDDIVDPALKAKARKQLEKLDIPFVDITWDQSPQPDKLSVSINSIEVGRTAANYLLSLGLKSFAFIGPRDLLYSKLRLQGFEETIKAQNFEVRNFLDNDVFSEGLQNEPMTVAENEEKRVSNWVKSLVEPTGIFAANDHQAFQFLQICLSQNIGIENRHAVIGADNSRFFCEAVRPSISTVPTPIEQAGEKAAELLDNVLKGKKLKKNQLVLDPMPVIARESTQLRNATDEKIGIVLRYIDDNIDKKLQTADLARLIGVSIPTLNKRFRKSLGRSPLNEIHYRRFERAKRILRETTLTVAEVAKQCAFQSSTRFCIAFKEKFDETPSEFRKRLGTLK